MDGNADARFGSFREESQAALTTTSSEEWSLGSGVAYGSATATNLDESQIATLTAYYLMDR